MHKDDDIARVRGNLGERIRLLRKERGLSQRVFGEMISLDRTYIIAVEKGRRNVSVDNLIKISQGLDVTLSELTFGVEYDSSKA